MPNYRITGAHWNTGGDVSTTVSARSGKEAAEIARGNGILISEIHPEGGEPEVPFVHTTPAQIVVGRDRVILSDISLGTCMKIGIGVGLGFILLSIAFGLLALIVRIMMLPGR